MSGAGDILKSAEGRPEGGDGKLLPREFFWDSIVLCVVCAMIGLAAVDTIAEYVRGSTVECACTSTNATTRENMRDAQKYVNGICSSGLPPGQYFQVFIVVHAILIGIPHYLWLNQYGGNFDYFFQLAAKLDRLREESSGDFCKGNALILEQLEMAFTDEKGIFRLYCVKLLIQLAFSSLGLIAMVAYFTDFNANFVCPRRLKETLAPSWPLPGDQVVCVFTSLHLLSLIRIADIILTCLSVLGLGLSLIWCCCVHATELGSEEIAKISFECSLQPDYIRTKLTLFTFFSGPRICTNFDFMMMKLFRTDGGLGLVLKAVQILGRIKVLNDADCRRLNLLKRHILDKDQTADLKWKFPTDEIKHKKLEDHEVLILPKSIRGIVLGFAARSQKRFGALCVTFGSPSVGFPCALGRLFHRVGYINFSPYYHNPDCPVKRDVDTTLQMVTILTSDDILATNFEFKEEIEEIWKPGITARLKKEKEERERRAKDGESMEVKRKGEEEEKKIVPIKSDYIVIGPIDKKYDKKDDKSSTVDILMQHVRRNIAESATLLTVHPMKIGEVDVEEKFVEYVPPEKFGFFESDPKVLKAHLVKEKELVWSHPVGVPGDAGKYVNSFTWEVPVGKESHGKFKFAFYTKNKPKGGLPAPSLASSATTIDMEPKEQGPMLDDFSDHDS